MCSFSSNVSCFRRHDVVSVLHLHEVFKIITIMICKRLARTSLHVPNPSCFMFSSSPSLVRGFFVVVVVEALLMIERVISLLESGNRGLSRGSCLNHTKNYVPQKSHPKTQEI